MCVLFIPSDEFHYLPHSCYWLVMLKCELWVFANGLKLMNMLHCLFIQSWCFALHHMTQPPTTTNLIRCSFSVYSPISASHVQAEWQLMFKLVYKYTEEECILSVTVMQKIIQLVCAIGNFNKNSHELDISVESITHFLANRFKTMGLVFDHKIERICQYSKKKTWQ
jgi:hypothetical protein